MFMSPIVSGTYLTLPRAYQANYAICSGVLGTVNNEISYVASDVCQLEKFLSYIRVGNNADVKGVIFNVICIGY